MARRRRSDPRQQHGLLILDKPKGPTSAACLEAIKRNLGQPKIGHAGTLDPMATGILLVLLGQGTKLATYLTGCDKTYSGRIRLGVATDTYDAQGRVTSESPIDLIRQIDVEKKIAAWTELTEQEVPPVSAAKHKGTPLYALARAGKDVPVKTKTIKISHVEVLETDLPWVRFRVRVSAGTYIRSLAHSLGIRLGCGAMLDELTRERCHPYGLDQAIGLDRLLEEPERLGERVIPMGDALPHWPTLPLTERQLKLVKNGAWLPVADGPLGPDGPAPEGCQAMFTDPMGGAVALVETRHKDGRLAWAILRGLWN